MELKYNLIDSNSSFGDKMMYAPNLHLDKIVKQAIKNHPEIEDYITTNINSDQVTISCIANPDLIGEQFNLFTEPDYFTIIQTTFTPEYVKEKYSTLEGYHHSISPIVEFSKNIEKNVNGHAQKFDINKYDTYHMLSEVFEETKKNFTIL